MLTTPAIPTEEYIYTLLEKVMDPEIPFLSVLDLGMITGVMIDDRGAVTVKFIPTYNACPATRYIQNMIREDIKKAGIENIEVVIDTDVNWDSNRINDKGRAALAKAAITPPQRTDDVTPEQIEAARCPHCGSDDTTMKTMFGSTLCRSQHFCFGCMQWFEKFKPMV